MVLLRFLHAPQLCFSKFCMSEVFLFVCWLEVLLRFLGLFFCMEYFFGWRSYFSDLRWLCSPSFLEARAERIASSAGVHKDLAEAWVDGW